MVISKTYAKSLFESLKKSSNDQSKNILDFSTLTNQVNFNEAENNESLYQELKLLSSFLEFFPEILKLYKNPLFSEKKKFEVIISFFPGISKKLKSFLKILAERNSLFLLPEITKEYEKFLNFSAKKTEIRLVLAGSLNPNLGSQYLKIFRNLTNSKNISLFVDYNPQLLSGFTLEYNSLVIDASIIRELESIIF